MEAERAAASLTSAPRPETRDQHHQPCVFLWPALASTTVQTTLIPSQASQKNTHLGSSIAQNQVTIAGLWGMPVHFSSPAPQRLGRVTGCGDAERERGPGLESLRGHRMSNDANRCKGGNRDFEANFWGRIYRKSCCRREWKNIPYNLYHSVPKYFFFVDIQSAQTIHPKHES